MPKKQSVPKPEKQKQKSNNLNENEAAIFIKGARTHNLQNVSVSIPRNQLVVITGVSGSGKSSLASDTLYAEGQRRYTESLSAYARQFMQRLDKPDVDYIKGLCPAIAIEQKVITKTPRSTVGTLTEVYDYLRVLYARVGKTISPISGREVKKNDVADVVSYINGLPHQSKFYILFKFIKSGNRNIKEELQLLQQKGFVRLLHNNSILAIDDVLTDASVLADTDYTYVVVDRQVKKDYSEDDLHRLTDSIEVAYFEGEGDMSMKVGETEPLTNFSNRFEMDGIQFEEPSPNLFSFNNPYGACPSCEGFSLMLGLDEDLIIPDKSLSVFEGAVAPWKGEKLGKWKDDFVRNAPTFNFPIHKPVMDLTSEQYNQLWNGNQYVYGINDFFKEVEQQTYKIQYRVLLSRYRGKTKCTTCNGYRLRQEALYVKINNKHIGELTTLPIDELIDWFQKLELTPTQQAIAKRVLEEILLRLHTLQQVGLGYLTLGRIANTLSGGESQRIQLTRTLGSNLTNSLYILDEPSIGLHSKDTQQLIDVLKNLRNLGNTVVVVEHDSLLMKEADHIIDVGPYASYLGGNIVAEGTYQNILNNPESVTGQYLSGKKQITPPVHPRSFKRSITVEGVRQNNLKNITVTFPLQTLNVVSGVSGSGKTTLVKQILYPALQKAYHIVGAEKAGLYKGLSGDVKFCHHVEMVDQNPIGKSSRSNPVTYIKAFDAIRELFAEQQLSKIRGYTSKYFSFNTDGGRCDTCKGEGEIVVEMQFLADVHLTCDVCHGKRYKKDVLEVEIDSKSIYYVLEMTVDEAIHFFENEAEKISKKNNGTRKTNLAQTIVQSLQPLQEVGLGYIKLGQSSSTLSGGEAQRVKLASFLGKGKETKQRSIFIFDEPTTGLHMYDISKLLKALNALVEQGHTVIIIEHNIDVIKSADWLIELGPDAGDKGGYLVYAGVPKGIQKVAASYTAAFLKHS